MSAVLQELRVGDPIPRLQITALTQGDLRRYAEASADHAAVHLDDAYARALGFPGVIAHGLLVMAYLGRALSDWQPANRLRTFSCRFLAVTLLGDRLECSGSVAALRALGDERVADLDLEVRDGRGQLKLSGKATVCIGNCRGAWV
jgi:acyl dehydratase